MSLTFDRLDDLRIKYPKPKFAFKECTKRLQKHPQDPYLQAWKAELTVNAQPQDALSTCYALCNRQPPIADLQLLEFIYRLTARARKLVGEDSESAGPEIQALWQAVAKSKQRKEEREKLFINLFECAVSCDCWTDVRWAAMRLRSESPSPKAFFSLIFACEVLVEKQLQVANSKSVQTTRELTYRMLMQAVKNKSKEGDKITEVRHLRLLLQIFRRQGRQKELLEILDDRDQTLASIINSNSLEFSRERLSVLEEASLWEPLWQESKSLVTKSLEGGPDAVYDWSQDWKTWRTLTQAESHTESKHTAELVDLIRRASEARPEPTYSRQMALVNIYYCVNAEKSRLYGLCTQYWDMYNTLNCCFSDLRPFVESFDTSQEKDFQAHLGTSSKMQQPSGDDVSQAKKWFQAELNTVKFTYHLSISRPPKPAVSVMEPFVCYCIKLYHLGAQFQHESYREAGTLAYLGLLRLQETAAESQPGHAADKIEQLYLVQAGLLLLHMTSGESGKHNRALILLAVRHHICMGLATIAFSLWGKARVKEILNESLSYILLTRISQIHPFDSSGSNRLSPDSELQKVIRTYERMENRVGDLVGAHFKTFQFDQGFEMLSLKKSLKGSLSKHFWILERRRIARLKGESCDEQDLALISYDSPILPDNRDFKVLPNFGASGGHLPWFRSAIGDDPDAAWFLKTGGKVDRTMSMLSEEQPLVHHKDVEQLQSSISSTHSEEKAYPESPRKQTDFERTLEGYWTSLHDLVMFVIGPPTNGKRDLDKGFCLLADVYSSINDNIHEPIDKDTKTRTVPGAGSLQFLFGVLELLRATNKLCDITLALLKAKTSNHVKGNVKKATVDKVQELVGETYRMIRKSVTSRIDETQNNGVQTLMGHVRSGPIGKELVEVLGETSCRAWAREYVDSAVDALEGILKVKVK